MSLKSLWYKRIFTSQPWADVRPLYGQNIVLDYNKAFIDDLRVKAGADGIDASDGELIKFYDNPDYFAAKRREVERLEAERLDDLSKPKVELGYEDGKPVIKSYNKAFVEEQRKLLGEICDGRSDEEVISLFIDRDSLDREEPKLEVLHLGIEEDGKVKVKLDWNRAFIRHLKDHGITGDTEDEAIQKYLQMLTLNELQGDLDPEEFYSREQLEAAFAEMDHELKVELEEAKKPRRPYRRRTMK